MRCCQPNCFNSRRIKLLSKPCATSTVVWFAVASWASIRAACLARARACLKVSMPRLFNPKNQSTRAVISHIFIGNRIKGRVNMRRSNSRNTPSIWSVTPFPKILRAVSCERTSVLQYTLLICWQGIASCFKTNLST